MFKKMLCLLLAALMVFSMAACSKSDTGSKNEESASAEIDPATINTGKYDEPVHLTSFFQIATVFLNQFS